MHYRLCILMLLITGTHSALNAHVNTPRTFYNNADKKVRLTLWYKRYKHVGNKIRYEKRMRRYRTYVKPGRSVEITLRATRYDDLEFCYLMATNTRRRNEWAALTHKDLQATNNFAIACKDKKSLLITPAPRNLS